MKSALELNPWGLWKWKHLGRVYVLVLLHDAHPANLKLAWFLSRTAPSGVLVFWWECSVHQLHLCSGSCLKALDYTSNMFCLANLLRTGPTFKDLIGFAKRIVSDELEIEYGDPDPADQRYAAALLTLLYVEYTDDAVELMDEPARRRHVEKKQRNAEEFTRFFLAVTRRTV